MTSTTEVLDDTSLSAHAASSRRATRRRTTKRLALVFAAMVLLTGCETWTEVLGTNSSSKTVATWDGGDNWLQLTANRRNTQSLCTTLWFDWDRGGSHYDARAVRDCTADGFTSVTQKWTEYTSVTGLQKAAACSTPVEPPSTPNGCKKKGSGSIENFAPFSSETCISWRIRYGSGTSEYNSGGNKGDCSS